MKLTKSIFYFLLFLLTTAAVSRDTTPGMGLSEGSTVPELTLQTTDIEPLPLSSYRGKMVLLQFWASSDAESRIRNVQISNLLKAHQSSSLKMVSVALDASSEVAREIGRMDGLRENDLFTVNSVLRNKTMSKFRINSQTYGNFLLNEEGVIIGRDLSAAELKMRFGL